MIRLKLFLIPAFILSFFGNAFPCTLWGSIGSVNQTRDVTFIVKNRDWRPNQTQTLKIVKSAKGYPYLGLYALGDDEPGLKAGINKKGLVIISASAGRKYSPRAEETGNREKRYLDISWMTRSGSKGILIREVPAAGFF